MSVERLLQLLHASNKYGFALVFVGAVLLLDKSFGFLPFRIPGAVSSGLFVAALLGAGMLVASLIVWLASLIQKGCFRLKEWWKAKTVMNRIDELTAREQLALYWIAHHKGANVKGSRFADPFNRLSKKGFLISTDETGAVQGFKVNPQVYKKKDRLLPYIGERFRHIRGDYDHPW